LLSSSKQDWYIGDGQADMVSCRRTRFWISAEPLKRTALISWMARPQTIHINIQYAAMADFIDY